MRLGTVFVLLLVALHQISPQETTDGSSLPKIDEFKTRYFQVIKKDHKFHEIDVGIPESEGMYLGAFGDLNGNRK